MCVHPVDLVACSLYTLLSTRTHDPAMRLGLGFALAIVLVCLSSCQAASQSQKNRRWDRVWKRRRKDCIAGTVGGEGGEGENCALQHPDENDNCVNKCTSRACYAEVYASNPLEPGEIDMPRLRDFQRCARNEAREANRRRWEAQREEV